MDDHISSGRILRLDVSKTMTANLNIGTHVIKNVADPVNMQDEATVHYVNAVLLKTAPTIGDAMKNQVVTLADQILQLNGTNAMMGRLNMGVHSIINVADLQIPQDAITKNYVDSLMQFKSWVLELSSGAGIDHIISGNLEKNHDRKCPS